ncbi:hypothetical protein ACYSNR_01090 [Enterococcus sp. LJL128]
MNQILVYAKEGTDRMFIGIFDSMENILEEVESKLMNLGLIDHFKPKHIYAKLGPYEEYRLFWREN